MKERKTKGCEGRLCSGRVSEAVPAVVAVATRRWSQFRPAVTAAAAKNVSGNMTGGSRDTYKARREREEEEEREGRK